MLCQLWHAWPLPQELTQIEEDASYQALWLWASELTSLTLSFLLCERKRWPVLLAILWGGIKDQHLVPACVAPRQG